MPDIRVPADDFKIGDLVHVHDGRTVEVRNIERGDKGLLTVNPGAEDQLDGRVWEQADITRPSATAAEKFPIHKVRFINGRTYHRTRRPIDNRWWDLLEAACGKTGYKTDAYTFGAIAPCRGCERAIAADQPGNAERMTA